MLRPLFALSGILLSLSSLPAFAADTALSCKLAERNGDEWSFDITASDRAASSKVVMNGVEIPAVRPCMTWAHGNPRMGGNWRCPHGAVEGEIRFEVYLMLTPPNKRAPFVRLIRWNGEMVESTIDVTDCK